MTFTETEKRKAKRLGKEFGKAFSHMAVLRLVHERGEEGARKALEEWTKAADAELRDRGLR